MHLFLPFDTIADNDGGAIRQRAEQGSDGGLGGIRNGGENNRFIPRESEQGFPDQGRGAQAGERVENSDGCAHVAGGTLMKIQEASRFLSRNDILIKGAQHGVGIARRFGYVRVRLGATVRAPGIDLLCPITNTSFAKVTARRVAGSSH